MEIVINDYIKNKNITQCISYLREKTKCYDLMELLCEKAVSDESIEKTHVFWDDYAIALFYLGKKARAYACYKQIFSYSKTSLHECQINHYVTNMKYSAHNMIKENTTFRDIRSCLGARGATLIDIGVTIKNNNSQYNLFNPSIVKTQTGYTMNMRAANYMFDNNFTYAGIGYCHTINYVAKLDVDLNVIKTQELSNTIMPYQGNYDGWEDMRLFYYKNKLHGSFTTLSATPNRLQHICLTELETLAPKYTLLDGYGNSLCQKNWVPIVIKDNLYFIYSFYPLTVLKYSEEQKNVELHQVSLPSLCNKWRGGSPAIHLQELGYDDFYLCVVHESNFPKYTHRFVLLKANQDDILEVYNYTPAFCFIDPTIEFCAGLAISHDKGDLIASFGKMDRQVHIAKIDARVILNSLLRDGLKLIERYVPSCSFKLDSPYTFVTCFFNLEKLENRPRKNPISLYIEKSKFLLNLNIRLVVYCDDDAVIAHITQIRDKYKHITKIIKLSITELPAYKHYDLIKSIRDNGDYGEFCKTKDTPLFTLLTWSKFYFLQDAITNNWHNDKYFMWIDFGVIYVAAHNNYISSFNIPSEKVMVECINLPTQDIIGLIGINNKRLCYLAGGLIGGNKQNMSDMCNKFNFHLNKLIERKLAPLEEGILSYVSYLHPELFEYYYGDYEDIIDNRSHLFCVKNLHLMLSSVISAHSHRMHSHACHIVKYILTAVHNGYVVLDDATYSKVVNTYEMLFFQPNVVNQLLHVQ